MVFTRWAFLTAAEGTGVVLVSQKLEASIWSPSTEKTLKSSPRGVAPVNSPQSTWPKNFSSTLRSWENNARTVELKSLMTLILSEKTQVVQYRMCADGSISRLHTWTSPEIIYLASSLTPPLTSRVINNWLMTKMFLCSTMKITTPTTHWLPISFTMEIYLKSEKLESRT